MKNMMIYMQNITQWLSSRLDNVEKELASLKTCYLNLASEKKKRQNWMEEGKAKETHTISQCE
jgi:septal ring factor EnvC (AmiA/AmiB activator)